MRRRVYIGWGRGVEILLSDLVEDLCACADAAALFPGFWRLFSFLAAYKNNTLYGFNIFSSMCS
jgi:hypothetical protein